MVNNSEMLTFCVLDRRSFLALAICLAGVFSAIPAVGQGYVRVDPTTTNAAYYYYALPGEATVQVSVLGTVRYPGIYAIRTNTTMDELLAMAGGPAEPTRENVRSTVSLRLFRGQGSERYVPYEVLLDSMLVYPQGRPNLLEGDVLAVRTDMKRLFNWRDGMSIFGTMATITLVVFRIIEIRN